MHNFAVTYRKNGTCSNLTVIDRSCLLRTLWDGGTIPIFSRHCRYSMRMASLYFCQPHAQNQGMLRAVLKRDDCKHLADPSKLTYLGEEFPNLSKVGRDARDFALLRVTADEANAQWK